MAPESTTSNLGLVMDVSLTGACLRGKQLSQDTVHPMWLRTHGGFVGSLNAKVIWQRKCGFRECMIGLQFLNVDETTLAELKRLLAVSRNQRTF